MEADRGLIEKLEEAREMSWSRFGKEVVFYVPGLSDYEISFYRTRATDFPAISLTGSSCSIRCKHCRGKVLETMIQVDSPQELVSICRDLKDQGCYGCLITGGSTKRGSIPFESYVDAIREVHDRLGLKVLMHVGMVTMSQANLLRKARIDAVLADVIGSDRIPREVFGVDAAVEDYMESLTALMTSGIRVVPHLTVGLYYGRIEGEYRALELISDLEVDSVVIGALMPLPETPFQDLEPPTPEQIANVLVEARHLMPDKRIILGCSRPSGAHRVETDRLALLSGVNAIALPMEATVSLAERMGISYAFCPVCCALPPEELH